MNYTKPFLSQAVCASYANCRLCSPFTNRPLSGSVTLFAAVMRFVKEFFSNKCAVRIDKFQDWHYNNDVINNAIIEEREVEAWQKEITPWMMGSFRLLIRNFLLTAFRKRLCTRSPKSRRHHGSDLHKIQE